MKNQISQTLLRLALILCALVSTTGCARASDLSPNDNQFLAQYENVRAALAADDLAQAKGAANEMGDAGQAIAQSDKLATARAEFGQLSEHAVKIAQGHHGYFVAYCPMAKKEWVQTSKQISNPYEGKSMLTCGTIRQ